LNSSTKEDYLKENSKRLESQFEASTLNYVSVPTDDIQDGTTFMHRYIENTLDGHISSDENANSQQQIVINNKNNEKPKTKKHTLSSNSTNKTRVEKK